MDARHIALLLIIAPFAQAELIIPPISEWADQGTVLDTSTDTYDKQFAGLISALSQWHTGTTTINQLMESVRECC